MRKLILVVTAVMFALGAGIAGAADMPKGDLMIDSGNGKKPGVSFNHEKHEEEGAKCEDCHHKVDGKENFQSCGKTAGCHMLDGGDAPELKDALHGKDAGACRECHFGKESKHKLKCADCHEK